MEYLSIIVGVVFILYIAFVVNFFIRRSDKERKKQIQKYLETDQEANYSRTNEFEDELFITPNVDTLPFLPDDVIREKFSEGKAINIIKCQENVRFIAEHKMIRVFYPISNVEIKQKYGAGNLQTFSQYEANCSTYTTNLYSWAESLYGAKEYTAATKLLIECDKMGSESSKNYRLLGQVLYEQGDIDNLQKLHKHVEESKNFFKNPQGRYIALKEIDRLTKLLNAQVSTVPIDKEEQDIVYKEQVKKGNVNNKPKKQKNQNNQNETTNKQNNQNKPNNQNKVAKEPNNQNKTAKEQNKPNKQNKSVNNQNKKTNNQNKASSGRIKSNKEIREEIKQKELASGEIKKAGEAKSNKAPNDKNKSTSNQNKATNNQTKATNDKNKQNKAKNDKNKSNENNKQNKPVNKQNKQNNQNKQANASPQKNKQNKKPKEQNNELTKQEKQEKQEKQKKKHKEMQEQIEKNKKARKKNEQKKVEEDKNKVAKNQSKVVR